MTPTIENRVLALEFQGELHAKELKSLSDTSTALRNSLGAIEKSLAQIKWLAVGALCAMLGKQVGLEKVLMLLVGI